MNQSEGKDMKKQELVKNIKSLAREASQKWPHEEMVELPDVLREIDQLDEPEVLSREWIINNQERKGVHFFVNVNKLQNLVVPKKELPVIPKYVVDWFEENKEHFEDSLKSAIKYREINYDPSEFDVWLDNPHNKPLQTLGNMFNGYEVEEEPLYYALIKGHELIDGENSFKYWKCDMRNGSVFLSNRYSQYGRYLAEMSEKDWGKFGINESNADFVEVKG